MIFLALSFYAALLFDQTAHAKALPESGSLFERFVSEKKGSIPYPIGELKKSLEAFTDSSTLRPYRPFEDPNDFLFVGTGRSLQKEKTNVCDPRILTMVNGGTDGYTFMGFAKKANQAEIISWNPTLRRFEFFILENYGPNLKPQLAKPNRALCLSCHQNGGPIFSRGPWREVNNPLQMHKFYNECLAKQPEQKNQHLVFKKYEGLTVLPVEKPKDSSAPAKFHCGAQAGFSGSHPACSYDDAVRMSKTMLDLARGCEKICLSGDQECKRDLLKLVINHRFSTASAKTSASRIAMHQRLKTIRSPSSVLPDRDPNAPNSKPRIPTGIDSIFANGSLSDQKADMDLLYRDEKATIFSQEAESPEASLLDPKTPRPETPSFFRANREENDSSRIHSDLSQVAQFCLSLSEEDLEVIDHMEPAKKKAALESAELGRFLEKTWPASKAVIAKEILRISEERELSEMLDCLQKGPAGQPNLAGVFALAESNELQQLTSKEPEAMFLHYCGSCHNERSTYKLPLNDLEKLKTYESFLFGSIKKALEKKEMPPKSPLAPELSEEDRKILLEFLR